MSFPELLDAARALPRDEQLQLARALLEGPAQSDLSTYPEHLRHLIPPNGSVIEYWSPLAVTDAAGWAVIEDALRDYRKDA